MNVKLPGDAVPVLEMVSATLTDEPLERMTGSFPMKLPDSPTGSFWKVTLLLVIQKDCLPALAMQTV